MGAIKEERDAGNMKVREAGTKELTELAVGMGQCRYG